LDKAEITKLKSELSRDIQEQLDVYERILAVEGTILGSMSMDDAKGAIHAIHGSEPLPCELLDSNCAEDHFEKPVERAGW
jgi:hypothetical protein